MCSVIVPVIHLTLQKEINYSYFNLPSFKPPFFNLPMFYFTDKLVGGEHIAKLYVKVLLEQMRFK